MHDMFNLTRYQKDHTCRKRTCLSPFLGHVMVLCKSWSCSELKWKFLRIRNSFSQVEVQVQKVHKGRQERQDGVKTANNSKANCCTLLKRITRLKMSIQKSGLSVFTLRKVPSGGAMAPCRSHHGNHTRQERIYNWSVGNWIPSRAN
jgi:hypothetical protein